MRDVTPVTWGLLRIPSRFPLNTAGPADDSHPPQRMALSLLFAVRPQRLNDTLVPVIVAAASTLFVMFLLLVLGSVFRTYSDILYRRSRPMVFTAAPPPQLREDETADDKATDREILQAILMLLCLLILAVLVGVDF